jgi:hypothetical protein
VADAIGQVGDLIPAEWESRADCGVNQPQPNNPALVSGIRTLGSSGTVLV